tara:strand:- start:23 stop:4336 length:4314 start_codon:yes stop_codon:yes gene_type:complete
MTPLEEALAEINKRGSLSPNPSPLGRSTSPAAAQSAAQLAANVQKGFSQYKAPVKSPRRGFGGAFGKFIDIIDTPRAAIASTVQEIVDVFQGEGFSGSDWWKQTKDNHLFGEIMRDIGVDLPGPLDFALGMGLDIAFDPLTYAGGAGVAARLAKADDVVAALRKAQAAAKKAGDTKKAQELFKASEKVRKSRSVLSAGKSLRDIGIKPNLGLTLPGTGRLGRKAIENPLNLLSGGALGRRLDKKRLDQIKKADFLFDEAGLVAKNTPKIQEAMGLMRRKDAAAKNLLNKMEPNIRKAATMASKLPVESRLRLPWSSKMVGAVAALPGRGLRWATQRAMLQSVDKALNTRQPMRAIKIGDDPDLALEAVYLERGANKGEVAARKVRSRLMNTAGEIARRAQKLKVPFEDLLGASSRRFDDPNMPGSILRAGKSFHDDLVGFWKEAETVVNEATGQPLLSEMLGDMYSARFLTDEGAFIVGANGAKEFVPRGVGTLSRRTIITPSQYNYYENILGADEAARLYKKTFFGEELTDVTKGVGSIEDQMKSIGQQYMGDDYNHLFINDFAEVIPRYVERMAQFSREAVLNSYLQDFGIIVKGGVATGIKRELAERMSQMTRRSGDLTKRQEKIQQAVDLNRRLISEQSAYDDPAMNVFLETRDRIQMDLDDLISDIVDLAPGQYLPESGNLLKSVQKDLGERGKSYAAQMSELGRQKDSLERIVLALKNIRVGSENPQLFKDLDSSVKELGDALTAANDDFLGTMLSDETVSAGQRLQSLLEGEVGLGPFDMKSVDPAAKRFQKWEGIYKEIDKIDADINRGTRLLDSNAKWLEGAQQRLAEQLDFWKEMDAAGTLYDVADPGRMRLATVQADGIAFQEQLITQRRGQLSQLLLQRQRTVRELGEESETLKNILETDIADEMRSLQLSLDDAVESGQTGRLISAADSQEEALKLLNDRRNILGFQEAYNEALSNQLLGRAFGDYTAVNTGSSAELFMDAMNAAARINNPRKVGEFGKQYNRLHNWWKAQATATPGFILRNGMGGAWINSQIAGVEMGMHSKVVALARAAMKAGGGDMRRGALVLRNQTKPVRLDNVFGVGRTASKRELEAFYEMVDSGIAQGGQAWSEVDDALAELGLPGTWNPFSAQFKGFRAVRNANEKMEFMLRGALAFDAMANKGKNIDEAWELVRKYHFDYSDLTNTERAIKRGISFWKWQKSILPVLVESMGKNPQAWSRLQQLKGELELGVDEEKWVPDYFGEALGIRLPFETDGGRVYTLPDLPFKDLAKYINEPLEAPREMATGMAPFIKTPLEMWAGKQLFGDQGFSGRYQQPPNSYGKIPGLMPILGKFGKAKKNSRGEWKMRDKDIYMFDSFMPVLSRVRRLFPNEESKQRRLLTSWISVLAGGGLRVNDSQSRRNAFYEQQRQFEKDLQDLQDIRFREI